MKLKIGFLVLFILAFFVGGNLYAQELRSRENPGAVVAPLIQTQWAQNTPYNDLFPIVNGRRKVTDCNNTAWGQIMAFHRHPARGSGQSTMLHPGRVIVPTVNFNVAYDWNNMLNTYTSANPGTERQQNAVAILMYHVSAAVGANNSNTIAMTTNFGYDRSIQRHVRSFYTDIEWEALIRRQLDAGLPVYYYGNYPTDAPSSDGYHAFVVDGYDNNGRFHINWGWGGQHDGWYSLNNLDPRAAPSTFNNEYIYINIKPDAGGVGSNDFGLMALTAGKTSISQNELFTVTPTIFSFGFFPGGQVGAALVDNNGNITAVIGSREMSNNWRPGSRNPMELSCFIPETIRPGQYRLMAVTRTTGGDWKIVTRSAVRDNVPNAININVTAGEANGGGYGFGLTAFSASNTAVSRNGSFPATIGLRNMSTEIFPGGQRGVALVDNSGNIVVVGSGNTTAWNPGASNNSITINCTIPNTINPGQYRLRVVVRPAGGEWRIVTMALPDVPTSIDFTVR